MTRLAPALPLVARSLAIGLLAAPCLAQASLHVIPAPAGSAGFGKHVVGLDDVDGDGVGDLAVGDRGGLVHVLSGATFATLHTYEGVSTTGVGALAAIDVTGDGARELVVGWAPPDENSVYGLVVVDPATATNLWSYGDFNFSGSDELRLAPAGDFDGDGLGDIILAATDNDAWHPADWQSSVSVVSAAASFPVWTKRQWVHRMGEGVASIDDVDGDGRREIVLTRPDHFEIGGASHGSRGAIEMYTDMEPVFSVHAWQTVGAQPGAELGEALAAVEDIDGDGIADLVTVSSEAPPVPGTPWTLVVRSLSGATGATLATHAFPCEAHLADLHEVEMAALGDLDGDGVSEVALVSPVAAGLDPAPATPVLRILSGATLDVLQSWSSGASAFSGGAEHVEVSAGPDLDGDGVPELLVGAPDAGAAGELHVLAGRPAIGLELCASAVPGSTGRVPHVSLVGTRLVAENDVHLSVSDLPAGTFALPVAAQLGGSLPMAGGSAGTLCLSGELVRLQRYLGQATAAGTLERRIDLATWAQDFGVPPVAAGERWHFQVWYRDVGTAGAPTSNFSDSRVVLLR